MGVWTALRQEFDQWRDLGREIPFWWRDDDAIAATTALDQLLALSCETGVPVHLAVIPAFVEEGLKARLVDTDARVLQHGWAHENHAPKIEKKAEYRDHRSLDAMRAELLRGQEVLTSLFGARFSPVFVPPWNRISPELVAVLPDLGFSAVSTFNARPTPFHTNTHIDPINWREDRSAYPVETLVDQTVAVLKARRIGDTDPTEPLGLLTHHLVHDPAIWAFTAEFLEAFNEGPVRNVAL